MCLARRLVGYLPKLRQQINLNYLNAPLILDSGAGIPKGELQNVHTEKPNMGSFYRGLKEQTYVGSNVYIIKNHKRGLGIPTWQGTLQSSLLQTDTIRKEEPMATLQHELPSTCFVSDRYCCQRAALVASSCS